LAMNAASKIQAAYRVDAFDEEVPVLRTAAKHIGTADRAADLIDRCLSISQSAFAVNRFDVPASCKDIAELAAERIDDPGVSVGVQRFRRLIVPALAEAPEVQVAEQGLSNTPDDPRNNLTVGNFYGIRLGNFEKALPFLSKSSDATMRALAVSEIAQPDDPDQILKTADGWWALGEKRADWEKINIESHAAQIYASIAVRLSGITATRVQQRIATAHRQSALVKPTSFDLIGEARSFARIATGKWTLDRGELRSSGSGREIVLFAYEPPDEYDVECEFTRLTGDEDINLVLGAQGKTFVLQSGAWHNQIFGVDTVDGSRALATPESIKARNLVPPNQKMRLEVRVRLHSFEAILDGRYTYDVVPIYSRWGINSDWHEADAGVLGLATQNSSVSFESFKIIEVSGQGKTCSSDGFPRLNDQSGLGEK
jgi:hypothetical protein